MASNPAGEVKSECELKVRPAVTTTQVTEVTSAAAGETTQVDSAPSAAVDVPSGEQTVVSSQQTRVGSIDNTKWQETKKETVIIEKTGESTTEYEVTSGQTGVSTVAIWTIYPLYQKLFALVFKRNFNIILFYTNFIMLY